MKANRFKMIVCPYPFFVQNGKILLARRIHTDYMPGKYSLPAGHEEKNERLLACLKREVKEETGMTFTEGDARLVHVMHRKEEDVRLDVFFLITKWRGEPKIMEPDKCEDIKWYLLDRLPQNTVPYIRAAIVAWQGHQFYQEWGW